MAIMAGKKKNPNAKYAFAALIVALVACVVSGLIGSSKILTGIGMFTLPEEQADAVNLAFQISIAVLILGLAAYAIFSPDSIRRFLSGRQARYGSNSLILALAFIGILFAVNYIVFNNPDMLKAPWDFTEDKTNTLAPETLEILDTLDGDIRATAFYTEALNSVAAQELLQKFKNNSDGKFDFTFVDPNANPVEAREAGITGDGKILLQMGEKKEIAASASETEIARAMLRLISGEVRTVYFLQGHGEATLNPGDERSYSTAQSTLEEKNYVVKELNLLSESAIPADANVIVIAGPQKPLTLGEVNLLKDFVENGGSLIVMEDSVTITEFGESTDPLARYLEQDWGITLNNDLIFDLSSQNAWQAISETANAHPITQNLSQNYIIIMPNARSLSITPLESLDIVVTPLISTSSNSWGETDFTIPEGGEFAPEPNEGVDNYGPLNMAAAGENTATKGRVVVFGNSLFAINANFDVYGNGNFFMNSVDWVANKEELINLTTRQQTQRIFLPPSDLGFLILAVVMIVVIPGIVVFFGISSWIARRRRG
jgi:ABC-type uncharacterized transport system involved in gliding motility auxiliary subunit